MKSKHSAYLTLIFIVKHCCYSSSCCIPGQYRKSKTPLHEGSRTESGQRYSSPEHGEARTFAVTARPGHWLRHLHTGKEHDQKVPVAEYQGTASATNIKLKKLFVAI